MELTGCAEKKMSFWDRIAPQIMAASYCLLASWHCDVVTLSKTHDPDASLRNHCSAYKVSAKALCFKCLNAHLSIGCGTEAVHQVDSHHPSVQEAAHLHSVHAPQRRLEVYQSRMPYCRTLLHEVVTVNSRIVGVEEKKKVVWSC